MKDSTQHRRPADLLLPYAVFFVTAFALYFRSLGFAFLRTWDDGKYVINNIFIQGLTLNNIKAIFANTFVANYAPFHILSYSIDYLFWELNPAGYHLSNILLHGLNACLAYAVIIMVVRDRRVAFLSAFLFVIHPLNVEDVAWISERKTLIATFFFLLSLMCYLPFREKGGRWIYFLSAALFVLAVLSKASAVVLPLLLMSREFFLERQRKWIPLIPFFVMSGVGAGAVVLAHTGGNVVESAVLTSQMLLGTVYPTMVTIFWKYISLMILPLNLSGYYDTTLYHSFFSLPVAAGLLGWLCIVVLVFAKGSSQVRFWFLWFWICLLPTSNIIPLPVYYADRYLYTPGIGLYVLAGIGFFRACDFLRSRGLRAFVSVLRGVGVLIVISYGILAYNRLGVWSTDITFWEDTVRKSPNHYLVHLNLGIAYENAGRFREAEREYFASIEIFPTEDALYNLDMVRAKMQFEKGGHQ